MVGRFDHLNKLHIQRDGAATKLQNLEIVGKLDKFASGVYQFMLDVKEKNLMLVLILFRINNIIMINFWNCIGGLLFIVLGIILIIDTIRTKRKIGKDTYGGTIKMGGGAIGFIIIGLFLLLKELSKL